MLVEETVSSGRLAGRKIVLNGMPALELDTGPDSPPIITAWLEAYRDLIDDSAIHSEKAHKALPALVQELETRLIREALDSTASNAEAARLLGLRRTTLLEKMKKLGLKRAALALIK